MPDPYFVTGIAACATVNGKPYVDKQGDWIPIDQLCKLANSFLDGPRTAGVMHIRKADGSVLKSGRIVQSLVITESLQKSLGVSLNCEPWVVVIEVQDQDVAKAIKSGQLRGLSISGRGYRTPIELKD